MWGRGDAARQAEKVSLQHPRISMQEPPREPRNTPSLSARLHLSCGRLMETYRSLLLRAASGDVRASLMAQLVKNLPWGNGPAPWS